MASLEKTDFDFPVGYHKFHRKQLFNFQLNRWYSLGYARYEDMVRVGKTIKDFESWMAEMRRLAEEAEAEGRLMNAAFYYRAAEFYVLKEGEEKAYLYDKFVEVFDRAFGEDGFERFDIPYPDGKLPAMRLTPPGAKKGTILMHGGFDSFIEEFYSWAVYFANTGYEVIAFEGPGQGGARRKYDLPFDYEWEKPVGAVLDFFGLDDVTLLGISMGGWLCLRAAAFEPRVKRVIGMGARPRLCAVYAQIFMEHTRVVLQTLAKLDQQDDLKEDR